MTSLETTRSLANGPIVVGGWGGIPRELQRLLSLIGYGNTRGFCGWSLTEGKIHWKVNMLPLFSIMTLWNQLPVATMKRPVVEYAKVVPLKLLKECLSVYKHTSSLRLHTYPTSNTKSLAWDTANECAYMHYWLEWQLSNGTNGDDLYISSL